MNFQFIIRNFTLFISDKHYQRIMPRKAQISAVAKSNKIMIPRYHVYTIYSMTNIWCNNQTYTDMSGCCIK